MGRILSLMLAFALTGAGVLHAETLRIATYNVELSRRGPGLLLQDILAGDEQVRAVVDVIAAAAPDILVLTGIDHDLEGHALAALSKALGEAGADYPHHFAAPPNTGVETGLDMDGNGRLGEARDAQGYGAFTGQGGMAVLSRLPLGEARDFSRFLWADLPGNIAPEAGGRFFPSAQAKAVRRLSSVAHWDVPVMTGAGAIHLLAFHAGTPVFDGPEDLNGRRNHDEVMFWLRLLDGELPFAAPDRPVVVIGDANLDPADGEGRREAIRALLADPRLQDARPASAGGLAAADPGQAGDPALDTADWDGPTPGNLRVDYVLPDATLSVVGAGVFWPAPEHAMAATAAAASRHHLVWVDIVIP